jgi:hypothetical protein
MTTQTIQEPTGLSNQMSNQTNRTVLPSEELAVATGMIWALALRFFDIVDN